MRETAVPLPTTTFEAADQTHASPTTSALRAWAWPLPSLAEGLALLAQTAGLAGERSAQVDARPLLAPPTANQAGLTRWLTTATHQLGCEMQAVEWHFGDIRTLVQRAAPALLQIPQPDPAGLPEPHFLLLLRGGSRWVRLLTPDQRQVSVGVTQLTTLLQTAASGSSGQAVEQLLLKSGIAPQRRARAKTALIAEQMGQQRFGGCWLLKVAAHSPVWQHLRHNRLPRYLLLLTGLVLLQQIFTLLSWRYVGAGVFQTGFGATERTVWALVLFTTIPLGLLAEWAQINLTLNLSRFARSHLLQGILNLNPSAIRHLGAGQFLERVMQTESFQTLLLGGGLAVVNALIQISSAAVILWLGVGGVVHSALLGIWVAVTVGLSLGYAQMFVRWRQSYRALTNDLVERMVAHRTRLAQENKATWHREEDQQLDHYHNLTCRLDNWQRWLNTLLNRGWFLVGLAGIALPFVNGANDPAKLAISIGGILLASGAFAALSSAVVTLTDIYATWRDIGPIFRAAHQVQPIGTLAQPPATLLSRQSSAGAAQTTGEGADKIFPPKPLLIARNVQFRYQPDAPLTLHNIALTIYPGDRLLLEGPSGGGKSTLASLLIGLQQPDSGLLLLHGLDQPALGLTHWRRSVVSSPQFHENHVLTETFGFNLLMGRRWPATAADLQEAEQLCEELGLGELLQRMPGGLMQMVGESGWQLSHGERSRLFIARALLQEADLIVLDESFGALDPINLERAIRCVLKRAPTLLVIAHP